MLGAIIGDVCGSRFEFDNIKTKDFELVHEKLSNFTDDSVLTVACCDWAMHHKTDSLEEAAQYIKKWARKYPYAGFGGRFYTWMKSDDLSPYYSCGNGSAMRISSIGWLYNDLDTIKYNSDIITGCTHNHPEGLKGAIITANCIFMARNGATKDEIKEYVSKYYNIDFDYEELRRNYFHKEEICQVTVPQAIYCFLISESFEDCIRTTISIGGDCDTTAAISCAIAEAYYKEIPEEIKNKVLALLTDDMKEIINEFYEKLNNKE